MSNIQTINSLLVDNDMLYILKYDKNGVRKYKAHINNISILKHTILEKWSAHMRMTYELIKSVNNITEYQLQNAYVFGDVRGRWSEHTGRFESAVELGMDPQGEDIVKLDFIYQLYLSNKYEKKR